MTSQTQNRLTAALATGVFLVVSILLANLSGRPSTDDVQRRRSTFFTDASGARALFLIMKQFLPSVERWRRPVYLLPSTKDPAAPTTLIVAGPTSPISRREADYLDKWLTDGGQLILLNDDDWALGHGSTKDSMPAEASRAPQRDSAQPPSAFLSRYVAGLRWSEIDRQLTAPAAGSSVPAQDLTLSWRRSFGDTGTAKVIAVADAAKLAVEWPVGQGRIIAIADPSMVSNSALRRSDNAVWLTDLAAAWGNGKTLFDEYHQGFGQKRTTLELTRAFLGTPWGWSVLQIATVGLLYLFAYRRRFGGIREPPAVNRASPLELLDARAGVFQAAAAQSLSADLIIQNLCQSLSQNYGKNIDSTNLRQELAVLNQARGGTGETLQSLYAKVQTGQRLSEREFVQLGRCAGEIIRGSRS